MYNNYSEKNTTTFITIKICLYKVIHIFLEQFQKRRTTSNALLIQNGTKFIFQIILNRAGFIYTYYCHDLHNGLKWKNSALKIAFLSKNRFFVIFEIEKNGSWPL